MQQGKEAERVGGILNFVFGELHCKETLITLQRTALGRNFEVHAGKTA
jgi:hypothetical protein